MRRFSVIVMAAALAIFVSACCNKPKEATNKNENTMIRINVVVTVSPDNHDEVLAGLNELAAESRKENGCVAYDIFQNAVDAGQLLIFETWESPEALDAHGKTPHYTTILPALNDKMQMQLDKFVY